MYFLLKRKGNDQSYYVFCEKVQPMWEQFRNFVYNSTNDTLFVNPVTLIFGLTYHQHDNETINTLLIWFKFYIYRCKIQNDALSFLSFKNYAKSLLSVLYYNDCVRLKRENFLNQWRPWLLGLQLDFSIV